MLSELGLADAYFSIESPVGPLLIAYNDHGIAAVGRGEDRAVFAANYTTRSGRPLRYTPTPPTALSQVVARRLRGERAELRFDLRGLSEFERATLLKATEIPRGEIRPYAWIAREIDRPGAVRAVGSALGRNPIPLLIPCHRIVRSDGLIGDYVFGNAMKRVILSAEGLVPDEIERRARARIRYHASDTTGIYCFPTCHNARRISDPHLVTFASDGAAQVAGYRPCKVCRPAIAS
ncbi:MAG TPA: methylated-DNA--[protein]-cysteine S-methyltransferase [Thermomicrobiales bacterium]